MRKLQAMLVIINVFLIFSLVSGCTASMTGTVVDAETGNPIEGAVVLVEWTRATGIGDKHTSSVKVVEKVTDKEGKFNVSGTLHPFVDPPDVTAYKKGYVAWNNKRIFPNYNQRQKSEDMYQAIKLDHFKQAYFHNQHLSFIRTCSNDMLASHKKKKFAAAYEWEIDLAREEILGEK